MTKETLAELMAALPVDDDLEPGAAQEQLREILADVAGRPVPTGSLHRMWALGGLSSQVALAYLALWMRQWYGDAEARKRRILETNLRVALKMFRQLGYLRGAMTKLGQAAGNLPLLIPAQVAETLDKLHFEAPPMHYSLIREMVCNELGRPPEEVFARFERDAFAAASLGQVHRAWLKSGEPVAVKIQYPGIARTIDADFRNLGALFFPLRLGKDWEYTKAQFDEIRRMLNQEVDYRQEAESMREARSLFGAEDGIVVPRCYAEYSTARVLTTDYLEGKHLPAFLADNPPQSLRDRFGSLIYRSHFRMYYAYLNYADPNPGNYIFLDDGRLGLIDFGCMQRYDAGEREILRLSEVVITDPEAVLPELLRLVCGIAPGDPETENYRRMMLQSREWMLEPMQGGLYDFGDEGHLRRGVNGSRRRSAAG
jgi:predicted unusual protein kinase regulating ubiquinone biosynthesis (AarF/ABC1/UbiB family)